MGLDAIYKLDIDVSHLGIDPKAVNVVGSGSGGAGYYRALAVMMGQFSKEFVPDLLFGISSSALTNSFYCVLGAEGMLHAAKNVDARKAFAFLPYTDKGNLTPRAIWRKARGKNIVVQDVIPVVKQYISKYQYNAYIKSSRPDMITTLHNHQTNEIEAFSIKNTYSYDDFLQLLQAATAAQGLVAPVPFRGGFYNEGGTEDFNVGHRFLRYFKPKVYFSFYARPQDYKVKKGLPNNSWQQLFKMINSDNVHKGIMDEVLECYLQRELGFKYARAYCDRTLVTPYDIDDGRANASVNSIKFVVD